MKSLQNYHSAYVL